MSTARPTLRERLRQAEQPLIGTFLYFPEPDVVRVLGEVPLDFVAIDLEHGAYGIDGCARLLGGVAATDLYSVVRVPEIDGPLIGKVLDLGADAVLVPHIDGVAAARAAVRAAKFPPEGERGAYPHGAGHRFGIDPDLSFIQRNTAVSVWALVEGREGVRNMAEIAAVPGIDAVFIGPVDLSHALGVPWQVDHPRVVEQVREIVRVAGIAGTSVAIFVSRPEVLAVYGGGFAAIACSVDVAVLGRAYQNIAAELRRRVSATTGNIPESH